MSSIRLQRFLSQAGAASRHTAEECVLRGEVRVNDVTVREMGFKVDPLVDKIHFRGKLLKVGVEKRTLLLNKPSGVMVTKRDPEGRKTVYDLVRPLDPSLNAVGRLDFDSEGLLLLSNDGDLAFRLTHPSYEVQKASPFLGDRPLLPAALRELEKGVELEEGITSPARIRPLKEAKALGYSVQIHEGKKRQVRRMLEWAGLKVKRLVRVKMGPLELGELPSEKWRVLTPKELSALRRAVKLSDGDKITKGFLKKVT